MKRIPVAMLILGWLAGCTTPTVSEAKQQAHERWYRTRANIVYGVAMEHFKVGQLDRAQAKAMEALALDDTYPEARLLLGKIHIEQERFQLAIAELTQLRETFPQSAEVHYLLGVAQEKAGLLDDALVSYRRCQALDGSNMPAVIAAAEVLVGQGQIREAQLYVESYVSVADGEVGVFELAGRLAMMQNDYAKAAERYQQACDLDTANLAYLESLAKTQFFAGRYEEAAENLKMLLASADCTPGTWVYTMLGDCDMAMDRPRQAQDAYYKATEASPESAGAWVNLAKPALLLKDWARAILAARRALALDPTMLDATLLLGYALLLDGQADGSLSVLAEAGKQHPDSAELQCLLGRAHAAAGNAAEAMRCYAAALRITPDHPVAKELLAAAGTQAMR